MSKMCVSNYTQFIIGKMFICLFAKLKNNFVIYNVLDQIPRI